MIRLDPPSPEKTPKPWHRLSTYSLLLLNQKKWLDTGILFLSGNVGLTHFLMKHLERSGKNSIRKNKFHRPQCLNCTYFPAKYILKGKLAAISSHLKTKSAVATIIFKNMLFETDFCCIFLSNLVYVKRCRTPSTYFALLAKTCV